MWLILLNVAECGYSQLGDIGKTVLRPSGPPSLVIIARLQRLLGDRGYPLSEAEQGLLSGRTGVPHWKDKGYPLTGQDIPTSRTRVTHWQDKGYPLQDKGYPLAGKGSPTSRTGVTQC